MIWIIPLVFLSVVAAVVGGYLFLGSRTRETTEIKKRLSLLEVRNIGDPEIPQYLKDELLSKVPLAHRILANLDFAVSLDRKLRQADLDLRVGTFLAISAGLFLLGTGIAAYLRLATVLIVLFGLLFGIGPYVLVNAKSRIRMRKFLFHFPDALEMFARSLRAGHSFTGAIQLVGQEMPQPVGPEFQKVFDEQNLGIPLRQALMGLVERVHIIDVKFFVTAVLLQRETGGNLAEIIDKISYVIRERFRVQGQLRIFTAQARLTGVILSLLPPAVAFLIGILYPSYLHPLWYEPGGRIMLLIGVVMQITGMLVIRKIIRIKI